MDCPVIVTSQGAIQGKISKAIDPTAKPVLNFLGIRYGKAPVGKLRFMPPEKSGSWKGIFHAVETYELCPQNVLVAGVYDDFIPYKNPLGFDTSKPSEDCLKLNVFTTDYKKEKKLPVLVWFTGGHYQRHYGGRIDGTALSGMNNAVVVVPNHRVNAFGFLSLGKGSVCPGNLAILDAILSLKWVKENISSFGGDPENVTIFGESSGSGIVHLLMLTQLSAGLFHKAILLSGAVLCPFIFTDDLTPARDLFLKTLGIEWKSENEKKILETLQSMPADKILEGQKHFNDFILFLPNIDGHVIKESPRLLIQGGHVHPVPLLIGCTNSEGGTLLSFRQYTNFMEGISEEDFTTTFNKMFAMMHPGKSVKAGLEASKVFYSMKSKEADPERYSWLHAQMVGDTLFVVPTIMAASAHVALGNPTYLFQMTQTPDFNHSLSNGPGIKNKATFCKCDHADDLYFIWGNPFTEGDLSGGAKFTDDESELSRHVMRYLVNFARSGDPNKPEKVAMQWQPYTIQGDRPHLILQMPLKSGKNLALREVDFYTKDLPSLSSNVTSKN